MSSTVKSRFKYVFRVLGRYEARLAGNEPHVTLNVLAGREGHVVFCGTLTMSEAEWDGLRHHLLEAAGPDVDIDVEATTI